MIQALLISLVTSFLNPTGPKESPTEQIRNTVRNEVLGLGFKLLFGVVLVSLVITSLVYFGSALNIYVGHFEYGPVFQLTIFGLLAIAGSVSLYLLFRRKPAKVAVAQPQMNPLADLQVMGLDFLEGLTRGLQTPPPAKTNDQRFMRADF